MISCQLDKEGTSPTRVLTVNNPQLAASNMAMQNASVKELLDELKSTETIFNKNINVS